MIDKIEKVSTQKAINMAKRIAIIEGMLMGSSSGANLEASLRIARKLGRGKNIITIFPDRGERYLSEKFSKTNSLILNRLNHYNRELTK
jgi:cysteine synthase A